MALIKIGSINDFAIQARKEVLIKRPFLKGLSRFSELYEVAKEVPSDSFELITSTDQRGVGLKSIKLTDGFEGFLQRIFNTSNEIYFVAWAYDLSGQPINYYPGVNVSKSDVLIKVKSGKLREFIGEGINLFPKRKVKGGIVIRIQVWESDEEIRNFGKAMTEIADAIKKAELNNLLSILSIATGISGASIILIKEAALELTKVIGSILQKNGDDYVDLFEGYYAADKIWENGNDTYEGNSSILTLNKY